MSVVLLLIASGFIVSGFALRADAAPNDAIEDHYVALWYPAETRSALGSEDRGFILRVGAVEELEKEIERQRGEQTGLELVQFDGYADNGHQTFSGAWEPQEHRTHFEIFSRFSGFEEQLARLHRVGYRLLDLSIYQQYQERKIAALWEQQPTAKLEKESAVATADQPTPIHLVYESTWEAFEPHYERLRDTHRLVAVESYRDEAIGEEPLFAAVWEVGSSGPETFLEPLSCEPSSEPEEFPAGTSWGKWWTRSELTDRIRAMSRCGRQVVDLETFVVEGDCRAIVRFEEAEDSTMAEGWLQLDVHQEELEERGSWLRGGDARWGPLDTQVRGRLAILVLFDRHYHVSGAGASPPPVGQHTSHSLDLQPTVEEWQADQAKIESVHLFSHLFDHLYQEIHLGLVHDAGTSGPPPGSQHELAESCSSHPPELAVEQASHIRSPDVEGQ